MLQPNDPRHGQIERGCNLSAFAVAEVCPSGLNPVLTCYHQAAKATSYNKCEEQSRDPPSAYQQKKHRLKCCRMLPSPSVNQSTDLGALPRPTHQHRGAYYSLGLVRWRTSGWSPWPPLFPQARLTFSAATMICGTAHAATLAFNFQYVKKRLSRWTFTKVNKLLVVLHNH